MKGPCSYAEAEAGHGFGGSLSTSESPPSIRNLSFLLQTAPWDWGSAGSFLTRGAVRPEGTGGAARSVSSLCCFMDSGRQFG